MSATSIAVVQSSGVTMLKIPPSWCGIELDLSGQNASRPEVGIDIVRRIPNVQALVCGPMFDPTGNYSTYQGARLLYRYLDTRSGINIPGSFPRRGSTISVADGIAYHNRGSTIQPGATFAIQGYPSMIEEGRNVSSLRNDRNATGRACVGRHVDGSVIFAAGTMGIWEMSNLLIQMGVHGATYMDGGGSTALYGGGVSLGMNRRRLPSYVIAVPPAQTIMAAPPVAIDAPLEEDTDYDDPAVGRPADYKRPDLPFVRDEKNISDQVVETMSSTPVLVVGGLALVTGIWILMRKK